MFFVFFFHKKSLQHYEGVQRTILKTKGLLWGGECTIWTIYNTLYAFYFLFMTVSSVHIIICNHN